MGLAGGNLRERFGLRPTTLEETAHFRLYREFVRYLHDLVETMIH